ncbi:MAG: cellulose synthase catalytic subunit, partial [Pseudomonadota bacterium]
MPDNPYFKAFEHRQPPNWAPFSRRRATVWHGLAGATVAFSALYLHWRWTASLNPEALLFSIAVALAETLFFLGTLIFYFDIWDEGDTPRARPPTTRAEAALDQAPGAPITVDIFITTYDEDADVVRPSIADAQAVRVPPGHTVAIWLLDDGRRDSFRAIAKDSGVGYLTRPDNRGYKAGNLRNALFHTGGDFVVICDADTRLFPSFLENTLGYFQDPQVAWVQTPHWFYDIPEGRPWAETLAHATGLSPQSTALRWASAGLRAITGRPGSGSDPFLSEPGLFFDIIQRRRNRHGASFCCGAGSVHRREAVFHGALRQLGQDVAQVRKVCPAAPLGAVDLQPYRFHVSEDIYTSILLQSDPQKRWTSVYHPQVEARMLSPWTMQAWATQRLKYAGGTFDIMIHANPIWRRGMPWRTKLHYAATFWSYLACLWAPIMLVAPVLSLMTGMAPVHAYSLEFFAHFLPAILVS